MQPIELTSVCIIKDTKGNPKILFVDEFDKKYLSLKPVSGAYDKPLWFPRSIAFQYDQNLFGELEHLFKDGNMDDLKRVWERAILWNAEAK